MTDTLARTGAPAAARTPRRAWLITGLLVVFMLINFGDKAVLGLAADPIMKELGLSPAQYGLAASAFYLLFSVSSIVIGFIANRRSKKVFLLVLAAIWAVTQLPIVLAAGLGTILASRIVLGAAEGPANPLAVNAAQQWFPDERRNLPTSLVNLGAALGVVTLAPLLTFLIAQAGWRSAFLFLAAIGALWCIAWAIWGRDGDASRAAKSTAAESGETLIAGAARVPYRRIFFSGTGIAIFVAGFAVYWGLAQLVAWVPVYLTNPLGLGTQGTGLLVILPWLLGAIVIPLQGVISDRLMQRGVSSRIARITLSAVCILIAAVCMAAMTVVPGVAAKIALLTVAFSIGTVQLGIGMTVMAEITPIAQRAAVLATVTGVVGVSGIIAPAITGRLVEAAGATSVVGYDQSFLLTAALLVVGAVALLVWGRPVRDAARLAAAAS